MELPWTEPPADEPSLSIPPEGSAGAQVCFCSAVCFCVLSAVPSFCFKECLWTSWTKWETPPLAVASEQDRCSGCLESVVLCALCKAGSLRAEFSFWVNGNRRCEMHSPHLPWLRPVWSTVGCLSKWHTIVWKQAFITRISLLFGQVVMRSRGQPASRWC